MSELLFSMDLGTGFKKVNPPRNYKGLGANMVFTSQQSRPQFSLGSLEWTKENCVALLAYYSDHTGKGIGQGVPLQIHDILGDLLFDGMIDLQDPSVLWQCDTVTAPCLLRGQIDWFNVASSGFNYYYLATLTGNAAGRIIPSVHYKKTPYAISEHDNAKLLSLILAEFQAAVKLYETITKVTTITTTTVADAAAVPAATVAAPAAVIYGGKDIVIIIAMIIEIIAVIAAMVLMMIKIIGEIIQPKKYKLCMKESDLFKRGCEYLGLRFSSSIYAEMAADGYNGQFVNATYMPKKSSILGPSNSWLNPFKRPFNEGYNFPNNSSVYGYFDEGAGTFHDYCQAMMIKYNANIVVYNNVLYFEEQHNFNNINPFQIPNTAVPGYVYNLPDPHGTNLSELSKCYFLGFLTDQSEKNTEQRYQGTTWSVTILNNNQGNLQYNTWGGNTNITIQQALAKRKESLTVVEDFLATVVNAVDTFINFFINGINGIINALNTAINFFGGPSQTFNTINTLPTNLFINRIGWMSLSSDTFSVPKTFIGTDVGGDWEIHPMSAQWMSAENLGNNFHGKNLATRGNQAYTYKNKVFKFCPANFQSLQFSNVITTPDNLKGKFDNYYWDIYYDQAKSCNYRVYKNYLFNLSEQVVVDGG